MLIWIFVEMAIIETYSWLQSIYFGLGATELIAVLALLGIAPALVAPWRPVPAAVSDSRRPSGWSTRVPG
jgi:hypothetical protein